MNSKETIDAEFTSKRSRRERKWRSEQLENVKWFEYLFSKNEDRLISSNNCQVDVFDEWINQAMPSTDRQMIEQRKEKNQNQKKSQASQKKKQPNPISTQTNQRGH